MKMSIQILNVGKQGFFSIPIVHAHEWSEFDFLHFLPHAPAE